MKNLIKYTFVVGSMLAGLVGCQTMPYQGQAHDVKRKPQLEGIVAIPVDPRPEDRAKADEHMKSNCGAMAVKVLEEGEVVVGQETQTSGNETNRESSRYKAGSLFGMPVMGGSAGGKDTNSNTVTKAVKEWQISYQCDTGAKTKTR